MALENPQIYKTPENPLPPDLSGLTPEQRDTLIQQLESMRHVGDKSESAESNPADETISPLTVEAPPDFGEDEPLVDPKTAIQAVIGDDRHIAGAVLEASQQPDGVNIAVGKIVNGPEFIPSEAQKLDPSETLSAFYGSEEK